MSDSAEEIDKKINALWFPPYHGASIVIDGKRYSLVNDEILNKLAMLYSKK
jgi:methionyl-tRNA formyltransferase